MRKILISDFTTKEAPHGGSEWVNQVLIDKFGLEFEYSSLVTGFDREALYIISNVSLMRPDLVSEIKDLTTIRFVKVVILGDIQIRLFHFQREQIMKCIRMLRLFSYKLLTT